MSFKYSPCPCSSCKTSWPQINVPAPALSLSFKIKLLERADFSHSFQFPSSQSHLNPLLQASPCPGNCSSTSPKPSRPPCMCSALIWRSPSAVFIQLVTPPPSFPNLPLLVFLHLTDPSFSRSVAGSSSSPCLYTQRCPCVLYFVPSVLTLCWLWAPGLQFELNTHLERCTKTSSESRFSQ